MQSQPIKSIKMLPDEHQVSQNWFPWIPLIRSHIRKNQIDCRYTNRWPVKMKIWPWIVDWPCSYFSCQQVRTDQKFSPFVFNWIIIIIEFFLSNQLLTGGALATLYIFVFLLVKSCEGALRHHSHQALALTQLIAIVSVYFSAGL